MLSSTRLRNLSLFVLISFATLAAAQSGAPEPYDAVVKRLDSMTRLPLNDWSFHEDSFPHPELAGNEVSTWKQVKVADRANTTAGWFCRWIEIPKTIGGYDVTGERIRLDLAISGENWRSRVYFDGSVVATADWNFAPIVLTEEATPGKKIFVAVYISALKEPIRLDYAALYFDTKKGSLGPDTLRDEVVVASSLVPSAGEQRDELEQAVKDIDFSPLERGDQAAFRKSLERSHALLQPLGRSIKKDYSIRAVGNAHMDMAWLWPSSETIEITRNTYSTVLQLMRQYPDFKYAQSQAQTFEWIEDKYPAIFEEIRQRVKEGRWEIVGGMWVEPDLNMPDGESFTRQLLIGKRYFRDKFGVDTRIGWNPDSFGYNWQLPQIYKKSGIDYFVTQKMSWNDTTVFPYKLFWWQSPDGSRILTYFPRDYTGILEPKWLAKMNAEYSQKTGTKEMLWLYGVGDHGGGPTREMLDMARRSQDSQFVFPKLEFSTAQSFFDDLEKQVPNLNVPTWNGELYFEKHRGVQTSQSETKRRNRTSEVLMLNAEKLASLASLYGQPYPRAELNGAWKKVLFNQFHDILPGSGIATVYRDAARDHEAVGLVAREVAANASEVLAAQIDTRGQGVPVVLFNPLSWKRTEVVEFEVAVSGNPGALDVRMPDGKLILAEVTGHDPATGRVSIRATVTVPGMGYTVLHVSPAAKAVQPKSSLIAKGTTLENEYLRVQVDSKTGCITSLFNKKQGQESIAEGGCGNLLQAFVDTPKEYDAWDIDASFENKKWDITDAQEVKLVESSPTRAVIRVRKSFQSSSFVQDITLYPGVARVDIKMQAEWHEKHILLKAAFPLTAHSEMATFEIPYGTIQRPTTRRTPAEKAQFEVPALRWADISDANSGFSLLNSSKYGYDAKDNVLRISLLRSPTYPDPHTDEGKHEFVYSLYPHAGTWKDAGTVRRGYELNYPVTASQATPHNGSLPGEHSFLTLDPSNLVLTALKKAEDDNGLVIRFYEFEGRNVDAHIGLPEAASKAVDTNLMESEQKPVTISATGREIVVPTQPYEIKSLKVTFSH